MATEAPPPPTSPRERTTPITNVTMNRGRLDKTLGVIALLTISVALWMLWSRHQLVACPVDNPSTSLTVRHTTLSVEIAANDESRQCGLANRDRLPDGHGMLFTHAREQVLEFWMKDTHIPLTVAFIGDDYRVREIVDMQPDTPERVYRSSSKVKYALETNQGWFEANSVTVGDRVRFSLPDDLLPD